MSIVKCYCSLANKIACESCLLLAEKESAYDEPYYGDSDSNIFDQMAADSREGMSDEEIENDTSYLYYY